MSRIPASQLLGRNVKRKSDGAIGRVTNVSEAFTGSHSGHVFKTLVTVTLQDKALARKAGGPMVGDLGWFRSYFRVIQ